MKNNSIDQLKPHFIICADAFEKRVLNCFGPLNPELVSKVAKMIVDVEYVLLKIWAKMLPQIETFKNLLKPLETKQ